MPWFKSWFNSPYYHILYQHRDEQEAEIFLDNLIQYLNPAPGSRMLDLACGKGRHSVYLNSKGFEVTGTDLSQESIEYCRQFENDKLSFFVHDMRHLLRVNDFDFILNLFTSFGYFENEKKNAVALINAGKALKKGGKLVVDFMNTNYVITHLVENQTIVAENITFEINKRQENGYLIKNIRFNDKGSHYHFTEKVRTLTLKDFEKYMEMANLKIIQLFGDYELNKFDNENSSRLIIIAEKP